MVEDAFNASRCHEFHELVCELTTSNRILYTLLALINRILLKEISIKANCLCGSSFFDALLSSRLKRP